MTSNRTAGRSRRPWRWVILAAVILFVSFPARAQQKPYPVLDPQFEPLRAQFNRDAGKVRLLVLLDPT